MRQNLSQSAALVSDDCEMLSRQENLCFLDVDKECGEVSFGDVTYDFAGALRLLVFSDKVIQPFEKKFIIDALSLGLEDMSVTEKLALAKALSKTSKVSQHLADRLMISGPDPVRLILLQTYAYHSEKALCVLAGIATSDILLAMAERKGLTGETVLALISRENIEVTRKVLENKSAEKTKSVIEKLLAQKLSDQTAVRSLLNAPEMEPAYALKLFWSVGSDVRRIILSRFLRSHVLVESHFARIRTPHLRKLPFFSARHDLNEDAVSQGLHAVIDTFRRDQSDNAYRLLSLCVPLPLQLLEKIIQDSGGEAFVVLLKALGLKRSDAQKHLEKLSQSPIAHSWAETCTLCELYDMMSWQEARIALSYWLWQDLSLGPYCPCDEALFLENSLETDVSSYSP